MLMEEIETAGAAGEGIGVHACKRLGWVVHESPHMTPGPDIVLLHPRNGMPRQVQIKSVTGRNAYTDNWSIKMASHARDYDRDVFYVFVGKPHVPVLAAHISTLPARDLQALYMPYSDPAYLVHKDLLNPIEEVLSP